MSEGGVRLLICGSRDFKDLQKMGEEVEAIIEKFGPLECIIQGGARGADYLAKRVALIKEVPCEEYKADWDTYGRSAGSVRNGVMLSEGKPTIILAFPLVTSRGTWDLIRRAQRSTHIPNDNIIIVQDE